MDGNAKRGAARWFAAAAMTVALASMMLLAISLGSPTTPANAGPFPDPIENTETPTEPPATSTQQVEETPDPTNTSTPPTNTAVPTNTSPPNTAVPTNTSVPPTATNTAQPLAQVAAATAPPVVRALPATGSGGSDGGANTMLLAIGLIGLTFSIGLGALSWKHSRG